MEPSYKKYLQKMQKFNQWESQYLRNLTPKQKIKQFIELYAIKPDEETLNQKHKEHLNSLINIKRKQGIGE